MYKVNGGKSVSFGRLLSQWGREKITRNKRGLGNGMNFLYSGSICNRVRRHQQQLDENLGHTHGYTTGIAI